MEEDIIVTLKEQLEILRGEPIQLKAPIEQIPCIETSDAEKLCKHPVVSVNMITYNHEPYIRQAIEGVMMQQTDFEFELIIGEDASQDKTREICFEYQKKYPDKIRVLWSEENVNHLGGNSRRVRAHSRGEFIALCEGDDYWTDPLKLQKQVDIMRANPDVGLCFCQSNMYNESTKLLKGPDETVYPFGKIKGDDFFELSLLGTCKNRFKLGATHIMTLTMLFRMSVWKECCEKYEIFNWRLALGDRTLWVALSSISNVYYLQDIVSTYRRHLGGAMSKYAALVYRDSAIVSAFFATQCRHILLRQGVVCNYDSLIYLMIKSQSTLSRGEQQQNYKKLHGMKEMREALSFWNNLIFKSLWKCGALRKWMLAYFLRYLYFRRNIFEKLINCYKQKCVK